MIETPKLSQNPKSILELWGMSPGGGVSTSNPEKKIYNPRTIWDIEMELADGQGSKIYNFAILEVRQMTQTL